MKLERPAHFTIDLSYYFVNLTTAIYTNSSINQIAGY